MSHQGLQRVAALGLIHRSKSETQGLLSRRGGEIRARFGLLHLDSRDTYRLRENLRNMYRLRENLRIKYRLVHSGLGGSQTQVPCPSAAGSRDGYGKH